MKFDKTINNYLAESINIDMVTDGPPYIQTMGDVKYYYKDRGHTILHREDGPAIETPVTKVWFKNGVRHREGGPSYTDDFGAQEWNKNGYLHREDGSAVIYGKSKKTNQSFADDEWWLYGIQLSPEEIKEQKKKLAIKADIKSHKNNRIDPGMLEDYL